MIRTYTELSRISDFYERFEYLKLIGSIGESTFGWHRYINQMLYKSKRWLCIRDKVIIRDNGCDLGVPGFEIYGKILIHHMNPITIEDVEEDRECVYDIDQLICVSMNTHNAIHFSDRSILPALPVERRPGDTCPWR